MAQSPANCQCDAGKGVALTKARGFPPRVVWMGQEGSRDVNPRFWRQTMIPRPSVLCPIDFSAGSRGALRYAAVIAAHLGARLTVLAIDDPLLIEAAEFGDSPATVHEHAVQEM
jgi:hypothetical protein